jgi:hypothetical protein
MRSAPAFAIEFDARRAARPWTCALACVSCAAALWWLAQRLQWHGLFPVAATAVGALASAAFAWRTLPALHCRLRWDGGTWHLGAARSPAAQEWQGSLQARLDVGGWMLLRFTPGAAERASSAPRWLTLRHSMSPQHWHSLRCAVYSPRPAAPPDAAAGRASTKIENDSA